MSPRHRWTIIAVFAVAMGYLESAVVFYLRTMINRLDPYQPNPLPNFGGLAAAELGREFATMVMLLTIGWLSGRTWRGRLGFALLTFGIWDIAYYVFLIPLTDWPTSIFDWDILFLIPLPWWGPVWSPLSIALLMIAFGLLTTVLEQGEPPIWPRRASHVLCTVGIALALYVFMADAIGAVTGGEQALRHLLPIYFNWPLFMAAWLLMLIPIIDMCHQLVTRYR
ncbi:MAG: hypothetical protein ACXW32_04385 [Limisphaerales bacterium]